MRRFSATQKLLLAGCATGVFALTAILTGMSAPTEAEKTAAARKSVAGDHTMFGGSLSRNMVNLVDKGVPEKIEFDGPALLWKANLGSRAYGGPIVAGGKVFVGTNNEQPRNQRDSVKVKDPTTGKLVDEPVDKGILMCFDEKTGKFLWQAVHDKLPSGLVHDWPKEGLCSTPTVEGNRVYYVTNRCTVVCVDANGRTDGSGQTCRGSTRRPRRRYPTTARPTRTSSGNTT